MYVNDKLAVNRANRTCREEDFYPHSQSFDAYSLVMCKQLCSKAYFPPQQKFSNWRREIKPWWIECFSLKSRGKSIFEGHFMLKSVFLICTVVLLFFLSGSFGFCPPCGTTKTVLVRHRCLRFSVIGTFPLLG